MVYMFCILYDMKKGWYAYIHTVKALVVFCAGLQHTPVVNALSTITEEGGPQHENS